MSCTKQGATLAKATRLGIRTARLPIQEHLNVRMSNSLAINHGMYARDWWVRGKHMQC
jgi:hypothetical protein